MEAKDGSVKMENENSIQEALASSSDPFTPEEMLAKMAYLTAKVEQMEKDKEGFRQQAEAAKRRPPDDHSPRPSKTTRVDFASDESVLQDSGFVQFEEASGDSVLSTEGRVEHPSKGKPMLQNNSRNGWNWTNGQKILERALKQGIRGVVDDSEDEAGLRLAQVNRRISRFFFDIFIR